MRTTTFTRWRARIATVTLAVTTTTALAVVAPIASAGTVGEPPPIENHAAGAAIAAITNEDAARAVAAIPADFASTMGYRPTISQAMVVNPNGACSSPVTLPSEFDTACKAHDLGYDLLRYADRSGHQLGPWARKSVDAQLDQRMHTACDDRIGDTARAGCFAMADIATTAVNANSWRQAYVSPRPELPVKLIAQGAVAATAVVTLAVLALMALARLMRLRFTGFGVRSAAA